MEALIVLGVTFMVCLTIIVVAAIVTESRKANK